MLTFILEFMCLYNHRAFRDWLKFELDKGHKVSVVEFLDETKTWLEKWFGDTARSAQRVYFSSNAIGLQLLLRPHAPHFSTSQRRPSVADSSKRRSLQRH